MYWWIVIIVVIVLILILSIEHFEIENNEQLNNLVNVVNSNEVNTRDIIASRKVEGQELGDGMKREIMKIVYPVNSLWFSSHEINVDDKEKCKGTPLEFGKWEEINKDDRDKDGNDINSDFIFGFRRKGLGTPVQWGDYKISANHLPAHRHDIYADETGEAGGDYRHHPVTPGGKHGGWNDKRVFGHTVNTFDNNFKNVSNADFHPRGYYAYGYRKIEL